MITVLSACGGGSGGGFGPGGQKSRGELVSVTTVSGRSKSEISLLSKYGVDAYKLVYASVDAEGNPVELSGLLAVPRKPAEDKSPIFSFQHGTTFLNVDVPSLNDSTSDASILFASFGYIMVLPDYLGYGESVTKLHPYLHAETLASASLDMLRASQEHLQSLGVQTNGQLFLGGYSEGGYATLALQKDIQENHGGEFTITASAPGAGPYDLTSTMQFFMDKDIIEDIQYPSFVIKAYDHTYGLNEISNIYRPQYVDAINSAFFGNQSGGSIKRMLTTVTANLFTASFLQDVRGTQGHVLKDKLAENNLYDWTPTAPTRFFHGQDDELVPYANTVTAVNTMTANGATNISLKNCRVFGMATTHGNCALPYLEDTIDFFRGYAQDL
jgi:acetyl esterase/lipase